MGGSKRCQYKSSKGIIPLEEPSLSLIHTGFLAQEAFLSIGNYESY
jgi:hypothetical protein